MQCECALIWNFLCSSYWARCGILLDKKKDVFKQFYLQTRSSIYTDKKMKFHDSKSGVGQNFDETPVIMGRLDNVASRTKKVSN